MNKARHKKLLESEKYMRGEKFLKKGEGQEAEEREEKTEGKRGIRGEGRKRWKSKFHFCLLFSCMIS